MEAIFYTTRESPARGTPGGGLSGLAPERRGEFSSLLLRAFIGGTLAAFTTACVAGVLI